MIEYFNNTLIKKHGHITWPIFGILFLILSSGIVYRLYEIMQMKNIYFDKTFSIVYLSVLLIVYLGSSICSFCMGHGISIKNQIIKTYNLEPKIIGTISQEFWKKIQEHTEKNIFKHHSRQVWFNYISAFIALIFTIALTVGFIKAAMDQTYNIFVPKSKFDIMVIVIYLFIASFILYFMLAAKYNLRKKIIAKLKLGGQPTNLHEWSEAVKARDGYKCQICGAKYKLQSHHLLHKIKFPEYQLIIANGITLCKPHHVMVHKYDRLTANAITAIDEQLATITPTTEE